MKASIAQNFKVLKLLLIFAFVLVSTTTTAQTIPKVVCGSVKRAENFPSRYVIPRNVDVWLPEDYTASKKYAVMYIHDGQMLFDSTTTWNHEEWGVDETMCRLMAANEIKNCIVVAIWNTASRHPEYFPEKPFYSMSKDEQQRMLDIGKDKGAPLIGKGPVSDNYLKFIVLELKPYIDSNFSTKTDQQNTFIAGSSMGGLISMYAICEYPDVFGGAACLSTHWPGIFTTENNPVPDSFLKYLKTHLPSPKNHKIYFDYGSKTLDAMYKPYQLQADSIMQAGGYINKSWITREYPGDDHSERSWNKRLSVPLLFLLGK